MTDDIQQAAAPAAPVTKIVNFDAGESFDGETVVFANPFQLDGKIYTSATVRMATGADVERYISAKNFDSFGALTAFTGLPVAVLQRMSGDDYRQLDRTLGKLLWGLPPAAGKI